MNITLLDALPFLLLLLIAVGGLAYAAGFSLGRDTGNLEARNAAREERQKLIIRCKREGALAERALWVASSRLDLKPVEFEQPATAMDPHCVGNAMIEALDNFQSSVRQLAPGDASYPKHTVKECDQTSP